MKRMNRRAVKAVWEVAKADLLPLYNGLVGDLGYSHEEALDWVAAEANDLLPGLQGSLDDLAERLGGSIDDALTWRRVQNQTFREWLEEHDNPTPLFRLMFGFLLRVERRGLRTRPLR